MIIWGQGQDREPPVLSGQMLQPRLPLAGVLGPTGNGLAETTTQVDEGTPACCLGSWNHVHTRYTEVPSMVVLAYPPSPTLPRRDHGVTSRRNLLLCCIAGSLYFTDLDRSTEYGRPCCKEINLKFSLDKITLFGGLC